MMTLQNQAVSVKGKPEIQELNVNFEELLSAGQD